MAQNFNSLCASAVNVRLSYKSPRHKRTNPTLRAKRHCPSARLPVNIHKMNFQIIQHLLVDSESESDSSSSDTSDEDTSSSSSNSSMDKTVRRRRHRQVLFVERTVTQYDEVEFKENFRMDRRAYQLLLDKILMDMVLPTHSFGREKISAEKALLMSIWYLATINTFREIADRFNVSYSSAHRTIKRVITYFVKISYLYIKWPQGREKNEVVQGFKDLKNIDGVVGALDGSHIVIKKPQKDGHTYCNRKGDYSILLQGICNHKKKFLDIFCGEAGSIHDGRLLRRSSIYEKCINGFLGDNVLLGDSAYPCLRWLIPPFKDNGRLTQNHTRFNYRHSATRIKIEHAFGLLKGRFRRLRFFDNEDILFIVNCVVAACVFHNVCLDFDDDVPYYYEEPNDADNNNIVGENASRDETRRNEIFQTMFPNDN